MRAAMFIIAFVTAMAIGSVAISGLGIGWLGYLASFASGFVLAEAFLLVYRRSA